MKEVNAALKQYKITIKVLSGLCTCGGEKNYYSNDEYILLGDRIYFITFKDILMLKEKGILKENEIENLYNNICNKKDIGENIKKHMKSLKLSAEYNSRLNIYSFGSIQDFSCNELREIKTVMGSTIKGLFRHGFEIFNINSVNYKYRRDKRLNLYGLNTINDKKSLYYNIKGKEEKSILIKKFPKGRLANYNFNINSRGIKNNNLLSNAKKNAIDVIFRNTIFSDCTAAKCDFAIEKICSWNRKKEEYITPQYYETAEKGSLFEGTVSYKYISNEKDNFTRISMMYNKETPIKIALDSLKDFYSKVIDLEEKYYIIPEESQKIKEFYKELREENKKPNQVVCKLGYSGAVCKTLMCYDKENDKDKLLPYTLKYVTRTNLPIGWVKIKLEESKDEN